MKPLYQTEGAGFTDTVKIVQIIGRNLDDKRPSAFVSKESLRKDRENTFDDSMFFRKANYFHIDRIEVFVRDGFVQGFGITYNLDGVKMTKVNKGKKMPKSSYELALS